MEIMRAEINDIDPINSLLRQVLEVHHKGRPDIFKGNAKKYTDGELSEIIADDSRPIFVAKEDGKVLGYCFCIFQQHRDNNILTDIKTLYIDDLCVDEAERGKHVGTALYNFASEFARENGCYNVTLNVWSCNEGAQKFYEALGMAPQKIYMEKIL